MGNPDQMVWTSFLGLPIIGISLFSMELILLWSRGSILATPNRFYRSFKNWIPWPQAGHVFFSCTELVRFPWIFICCGFHFWRRPSPLDMRKGNGTIAPWPAFSMAKKGLEKSMTMMVKQGPVSSVAYQNESVVKVCFNNFPRLNQSALCPKNFLQLSPGRYLSVVYGLKGWLEVLP